MQLKYRCIENHDCKTLGHGKYSYDTGSALHLYNAQTLLTAERAVVVEGEIDAVSVEMAGVPAVAYPGVEAWGANRHWTYCFDSCVEVVVVADGDAPKGDEKVGVGERAGRMVAESLRRGLPDTDVRLVILPVGEDSNSLIYSEGAIAFLDRVGLL